MPRSAIVKGECGPEQMCQKRGRNNYKIPGITSCKYLRERCGVFCLDSKEVGGDATDSTTDPAFLVFEWMDHGLRTVLSFESRHNSDLPRIISRAVLSNLALLSEFKSVDTGVFQ
jgi:hypothetical protein